MQRPRCCSRSPRVASRAHHRRRRARQTTRWELRLGRDDLANPYRVQEAFEGIVGAIGNRWYERIWRGCDHFALEVHRLPDLSIRFTVAAPRALGPAIRGPLEDLYPDVELIEVDGRPTWSNAVVRLKKRRRFVLSIQTTRNYEHAFTESLVALLSSHDDETTVQLVLTPAPAFVHRRARRLLKRRERALQVADKRDPGELGIDSVVEAKELKGALELQHRSLALRRRARDEPRPHDRPPGRRPLLAAALRERARTAQRLPPSPPLRRADRGGAPQPAAGPADGSALHLGAVDALAAASRARETRTPPARNRQARNRATDDRARRGTRPAPRRARPRVPRARGPQVRTRA